MKEPKLITSLLAASIVIFLGNPAVVLADTSNYYEDVAKTTVSYADLDIENGKGLQELHERLRLASRKVCNVTSPRSAGTAAWRACNRNTFADVVDKFNSAHIDCDHAKLVARNY
jgi:UrcA family protein